MIYFYSGIDKKGKSVFGHLNASSETEAVKLLKDMGIYIIDIKLTTTKAKKNLKLRNKYIYHVSKELSVMLNSGLNIEKALRLVIESMDNEKIQNIFNDILNDIKSGKTLSESFHCRGVFGDMVISLIRVGESTGNLKEAFENIVEYISFQIKFKSEIINSLIYPFFLIGASFITIFGIFKFIIPKFFSLFAGDYNKLPYISKIIFKLGSFLEFKYMIIILFLIMCVYLVLKLIKYNFTKRITGLLVELPIVGPTILDYELSKFYYSMYVTLKSGLEFLQAFDLSRSLITNVRLYSGFDKVISVIKSGGLISNAFSTVPFLKSTTIGMIRVGEESGNLKEIFYELYLMTDDTLKNRIKKMLVLIEPIIITIMGMVIGTIVISLILTVMSVSNIRL